MSHRRHRPMPAVRQSVSDVRRPSPAIRMVDGAIQSRPLVAPADRARLYAPAPPIATATQAAPTGAKNTELRSKIAKIAADHKRLCDATKQLLAALGSDPVGREARVAAAAMVVANALLLTHDPEAP